MFDTHLIHGIVHPAVVHWRRLTTGLIQIENRGRHATLAQLIGPLGGQFMMLQSQLALVEQIET